MTVKRIIVCDVCNKEEDFDNPYRKKWFIENISHTICSYECFMNSGNYQCRVADKVKLFLREEKPSA